MDRSNYVIHPLSEELEMLGLVAESVEAEPYDLMSALEDDYDLDEEDLDDLDEDEDEDEDEDFEDFDEDEDEDLDDFDEDEDEDEDEDFDSESLEEARMRIRKKARGAQARAAHVLGKKAYRKTKGKSKRLGKQRRQKASYKRQRKMKALKDKRSDSQRSREARAGKQRVVTMSAEAPDQFENLQEDSLIGFESIAETANTLAEAFMAFGVEMGDADLLELSDSFDDLVHAADGMCKDLEEGSYSAGDQEVMTYYSEQVKHILEGAELYESIIEGLEGN